MFLKSCIMKNSRKIRRNREGIDSIIDLDK